MSSNVTPPPAGRPGSGSPIHEGEAALQERAGVRARSEAAGRRAIRDFMPDQHRTFFEQLPFLIVGSLDADDRPWASILVGRPGFIASPDPKTLTIAATPAHGDPLARALTVGAPLGLLGIQPETRRRNRMNGSITDIAGGRVTVRVDQSFGNCPQYIHARAPEFAADPATVADPRPVHRGGAILSDRDRAWVADADTFFIASAAPGARTGGPVHGVDVSHRGGRPGFVRVSQEAGATVLTVPDFLGNFYFNTLGNIVLNPATGLLFVDFASGDVLMLSGTAEVVWDGPEVASFAGAERLLKFRLRESLRIERAVPLRWSDAEPAPQLADTGTWIEAERAQAASAVGSRPRPFRLSRIVAESGNARSFHLEPADGGGVAPHRPGQYLPIALDIPGEARPVHRTYTLSDAPDGRAYRITVKREANGVASAWLHDSLAVGDTIRASLPAGDFALDTDSRRPVVLLSAGIGVTPMIAMLNHLLGGPAGRRRAPHRRVWFFHAARNGDEHPFKAHIRALAAAHPEHLTAHVRYSAPRPADRPGVDYDGAGRIDRTTLQALLPLDDYDVYLCGPAGFMTAMRDTLESLGVRTERIQTEAFGPAARLPASPAPVAAATVTFERSGLVAEWTPTSGSLLELAEANGIEAPFSCRSGTCGNCAAPLRSGTVGYDRATVAEPAPGHALICRAVPASEALFLDL